MNNGNQDALRKPNLTLSALNYSDFRSKAKKPYKHSGIFLSSCLIRIPACHPVECLLWKSVNREILSVKASVNAKFSCKCLFIR